MNRFSIVLTGLMVFSLTVPGLAGAIIIDDTDPGCKLSGTWADNLGKNPEGKIYGGKGCIHGSYHFTSVHGSYRKTGKEKATWTPNLPQAGKYKVEVTFRFSSNRSSKVAYEVVHSGGRERKIVNQVNPGKVSLGVFSFAAGKEGCVELVSDGGGSASADSAQFTFVGEGGDSSDSGTAGTSGLGDLLGGGSGNTTGSSALINLAAKSPGSKKVTISADGTIQARVCLRTYGPASLKITVNGESWVSWSRSSDSDASTCLENGKEVKASIYDENPGDSSAQEVKISREVKKDDVLEASLEGQDFREENTFLVVEQISQESAASGTAALESNTPPLASATEKSK